MIDMRCEMVGLRSELTASASKVSSSLTSGHLPGNGTWAWATHTAPNTTEISSNRCELWGWLMKC